MGRVFKVEVGGFVTSSGEVGGVVGRSHTGRSTPINVDYSTAREWTESGNFDAIVSNPIASRFREQIRIVPRAVGIKACVRGRLDDGTIIGWRQMGPPPRGARANRYNRSGDFAFYLCDSESGVLRELTPGDGRVFLQRYQVPFDELRLANFCDDNLSGFIKAVFDLAEACGLPDRGGSDDLSFPQAVAHLVRAEGFDGMVVPGVRGDQSNHYQNVVILVDHPWEGWSAKDEGFFLHQP